MSQGDPSPHPGHPAEWAGSGLVLRSRQTRGAVCCPQVGWLPGLEGDAILVWCENAGLRGLDSLASAGFTSLPDNGISEGAGGGPQRRPGPRRSGTKYLKGKESRTEARRN